MGSNGGQSVGHRIGRLSSALVWLGAVALGACSSSPSSTLDFESPEDGAVFTPDNDVDPATDGVQIEVVATTERLGDSMVGLFVNEELVDEFEAAPTLTFTPTLAPGDNTLRLAIKLDDGDWADGPSREVTLSDSCGRVSFVSPVAPEDGPLELGGPNFCVEDENQVDVVVSVPDVQDGADVMLVLNDNVYGTAQASSGTARFPEVELPTGTTSMYVTIPAEDGGTTCSEVEFPVAIEVDCEAPDCRITAPAPTPGEPLTSADDVSDSAAGLQVDVEVQTSAMADGQNVTLVVDGNTDDALMSRAGATGAGYGASFPAVTLANGRRSVRAECIDALGNRASATAEWDVDTQACEIEITAISPEPTSPGNVLATDQDVLEVTLTVSVTGDDCAELRSVVSDSDACGGIETAPVTELTPDPAPTPQVLQIGSGGDAYLCSQVRDDAGNNALASVQVHVINGEPTLVISEPSGVTAPVEYNVQGNDGRIADGDPSTPEVCDADLTVTCVDGNGAPIDGETVTLLRADTDAQVGEAPCMNGVATFSVANDNAAELPSVSDVAGYNLVARVTANGVEGESVPFNVVPDCQPPQVAWPETGAICGNVYRPDEDVPPDADDVVSGYQVDGVEVVVEAVVVDEPTPVSIYVQPVPFDTADLGSPDGSGAATAGSDRGVVDGLTLGGGQELSLVACTVDAAGNQGCSVADECVVQFGDVAYLEIDEPAGGALLFADLSGDGVDYRPDAPVAAPGCSASPYSIGVTVSTNAMPGSTVRFSLGRESEEGRPLGSTTVVEDAGSSAGDAGEDRYDNGATDCLTVPAGTNARDVPLQVTVEHPSNPALNSVQEVIVSIDNEAPSEAVTGLSVDNLGCRTTPVLSWDAVTTDNSFEGYEVRCAREEITDHDEWLAVGAEFAWDVPPGSLSQELNSYRPGQSMYCHLRTYDQAGAYSPISEGLLVEPPAFEVAELPWPSFLDTDDETPATPYYGVFVAGVGDVDADGFDDFFVGGGVEDSHHGYLYFGQQSFGPSAPEPRVLQFRDFAPGQFAWAIAPLGNIDNDPAGTDDFAFDVWSRYDDSDPSMVHVVLGRPTEDWPSSGSVVDTGANGCGTDVCIALGGAHTVGSGLNSAGDFDGDGFLDIGVGARTIEAGPFPAPAVVKGRAFSRIPLDGTTAGECVDLGDPSDGDYELPPCYDGSTTPTPAQGFWLDEAVDLGAHMASSGQGELVVAGSQSGGAPVQFFRGVAYPEGATDMVDFSTVGAAPTTVLNVAAGSVSAVTAIRVIGDWDGDGSVDYGVASDRQDRLLILFGSGAGESYTLTDSELIRIVDTDHDSSDTFSDFPYAFRGADVPGRGYFAELNADAYADIVTSRSAFGREPEGVVDVGWGGSIERGMERTREELQSAGAFQAFGPGLPMPPADPSYFARQGALVGRVDGDAASDFAILEYEVDYTTTTDPSTEGRILLLGICPAN